MLPTVSIVFLVYNRREKLRTSLREMLTGSDYPADRVDVIVVDNGSTDGSGEMVREEFPAVSLIRREENAGVSGWNDGFAAARGDYLLVLDDDCYLPSDGLRRAIEAAEEHSADLVSFTVTDEQLEHRFNDDYNTGLLSFWGCAVLMRREVVEALEGYDPEIFVWANELEFMMRFFDRGFCHLHLPEVVAVHMKEPVPLAQWMAYGYRINARHWAYTAAKLLRPRDAVAVLLAIIATSLRDALRNDQPGIPTASSTRASWASALLAVPHQLRGFVRGLRRRDPVGGAVSRLYRRNMHSFAPPWTFGAPPTRSRAKYFADRARYYPQRASTLRVDLAART